jgi:hypothetical protein
MAAIDIGSRLELMVDDHLIERLIGSAQFRLHHPEPREVVGAIEEERGDIYRYMTLLRDGDLYRMYYALLKVENGRASRTQQRLCLAQSRDGVHWEKPSLGLFEYERSSDNNIVWIGDEATRPQIHRFAPFVDTHPDCLPEQRYKALAAAPPIGKHGPKGEGLLAMASPDGVRWSMLQAEPVMTAGPGWGQFDSHNVAFYDAERGQYRLYRREVFTEGPLNVFRDILTSTSADFLHWDPPRRLSYPGAVPEQMYTNGILPYFRAPHLFVGFPVRYVERRWSEAIADLPEVQRRKALIRQSGAEPVATEATEAGGQRGGTALTDTLFMSSRDGVTFKRWNEAFIRPGLRPQNNWFYGDNFLSWGILTTPSHIDGAPDELSFYVSEAERREGKSNLCRRHTLRMDGFVSIHTGADGGELWTRPLIFSGRELVVNFSASAAGGVRIEIRDEQGWPLPGFSLDDCVELLGDDLERTVRWKEDKNLSALTGRPVRLRFQMADADLYAFRFR